MRLWRSACPDQAERIVFVTGGACTPEADAFLRHGPNTFLEKPFDKNAVEAVLVNRLGVA